HPAASMRLRHLHRLGARYGEDFIHALPGSRRLRVPGLAEDYFLFGQLALLAPCRNLEQKLIRYRWHGGNVGATRWLEQMRVALSISRHLVDSLAAMQDCASVDPAPFCTHGEALFEIEDRRDFSTEYIRMRGLLQKLVPDGADLRRELAFRRVAAVRSAPVMAARFAFFAACHGTRQTERRAVKSWLLRGLRRQPRLTLPSLVRTA
ncbi:MAG: glycosyltransferase family 2 protein, partial [Rugosibacter sp.]